VPSCMEDRVVLYVEDDDATAYLFQMAIRDTWATTPQIFRVTNGDDAYDFLKRAPSYIATRPKLVVLDLNLPGRSGLEILSLIYGDPNLQGIPVYVFTTSTDPGDRAAAVALGAREYLIKGATYESFVEASEKIRSALMIGEQKSDKAHG
jgi:CheY-like chemotaxis protein